MSLLSAIISAIFDAVSVAGTVDDKDCDWYCDKCGAYMNNQPGFTTKHDEWKCAKCGYLNDVSDDNIIYDDDDDDDDSERLSVDDAALIWLSNGKDEDYTFGYTEEELEAAL